MEIKTWQDVITKAGTEAPEENLYFDNYVIVRNVVGISPELKAKLEATYRIAKIIELGYGGMISPKEWKDRNILKYCIIRVNNEWMYATRTDHFQYIAFHTREQAEEFMSYPENEYLVELYYMML